MAVDFDVLVLSVGAGASALLEDNDLVACDFAAPLSWAPSWVPAVMSSGMTAALARTARERRLKDVMLVGLS